MAGVISTEFETVLVDCDTLVVSDEISFHTILTFVIDNVGAQRESTDPIAQDEVRVDAFGASFAIVLKTTFNVAAFVCASVRERLGATGADSVGVDTAIGKFVTVSIIAQIEPWSTHSADFVD